MSKVQEIIDLSEIEDSPDKIQSGGAKKKATKKVATAKSKPAKKTASKKLARDQPETKTKDEPKIKEEIKYKELPEPKYFPLAVKLPSTTGIFDEAAEIKFSTNLDYSRFSYGFHHFIHANKNKMEILKQFDGKKKVYLVMNDFERYVDNSEKSIDASSKSYFGLDKQPNILSRGFFKLWELFFMFDLIDTKKEKFISAHLAEGPGSFIQATMFYRDMYCKKGVSKNDKFYAVTLHPEDLGGHVPELEKKFVQHYETEKPQRFILHKTYPKQVAGGSKTKDNGDITDPKTIKLFGGQMTDRADFITADGGFDWINENVQEQEAFKLILAQIIATAKLQNKGGRFVCKFFETFTLTSAKLIAMLTELYDTVYMVKPLMSRASNSEKYAVCIGFKHNDSSKEYKSICKKLDELLKASHESSNKIVDLFPSYTIPRSLMVSLTQVNTGIANRQLKSINEIVSFIKSQNYYGETYQNKREKQLAASSYWAQIFYPDVDKLETARDKANELKTYSLQMNDVQIKELDKSLN